jgi:hypothetical protein
MIVYRNNNDYSAHNNVKKHLNCNENEEQNNDYLKKRGIIYPKKNRVRGRESNPNSLHSDFINELYGNIPTNLLSHITPNYYTPNIINLMNLPNDLWLGEQYQSYIISSCSTRNT